MTKYDHRDGDYPFSLQQKHVLRYIRTIYKGKKRASALLTYYTISWIASDFSGTPTVNNWPSTVASYSGLGKSTARKYIKDFNARGLISYGMVEEKVKGRFRKWQVVLPSGMPKEVEFWLATEGLTIDDVAEDGEDSTL